MLYEQICTPKFLMCFPALFEPRAVNPGQEPKYSVTALFPKDTDLSEIGRIVDDAIEKKWGKNPPANLKKPYGDGDAHLAWGECFKGKWYFRFSTKFQPPVVDVSRRYITDPKKVYGGQMCMAIIHAYAFSNAGNQGISLGLDAIQIVEDGEPIGGVSRDALVSQFEQLAEPAPSVTDMFDRNPAPDAAPATPNPFASQAPAPQPRPNPFSNQAAPVTPNAKPSNPW